MSRILVRKQDAPSIAPSIGSGGAGISFILGGGGAMDPTSDRFIQMYGEEGSPSHERAKRMQELGGYARLGLGAAGAVNSAYNQMASGQPGLGGAISSGAMSGYYGSSGLEDFAARLGHRFGRELSDKKLSNSTALAPINRTSTSDPRIIDAEFTEIDEPEEEMVPPALPSQRLLSSPQATPIASPTVRKPVRVMRGDVMPDIESDFGPPLADDPEFNYNRMVGDFS